MFIAVEGIDGAGKETQAKMLVTYFEALDKDVLYLDFPAYDSMVGVEIGKLLAGKKKEVNALTLPPKIMSMLFALDRLQFKSQIEDALANDKIVISNRFVLSSMVLQSARGNRKLADWIYALEHETLGLPKPDCYVVLSGDVSVTQQVKQEQKREYVNGMDVHESNEELMVKTSELYNKINPGGSAILRVACIEEGKFKTRETIHKDIIKKLVRFIKE